MGRVQVPGPGQLQGHGTVGATYPAEVGAPAPQLGRVTDTLVSNIPHGEAGTLLFPSVMALDPLQRRMLGKRKRGGGIGVSVLDATTLSPSLRQCLQTGAGEGFILARLARRLPGRASRAELR